MSATLLTFLQVDYNALAEVLGLKDSKSASAAWCHLKKKLVAGTPGASASDPAATSSPKAKTPRKSSKKTAGKSAVSIDDDGDDKAGDTGEASSTTPAGDGDVDGK